MSGMLEISDKEFGKSMINTLRVSMKKVDNMQEQRYNISREMEILTKNQKRKLLENKNTITEMKNAFDGLSSRLDTTEENLNSEFGVITTETSKTEEREKRLKKKKKPEQNIQELWDNYIRCNMYIMGIPEGEERNRSNI